MTIEKKYIDHFINVSSKAALASSYLVGKKDTLITIRESYMLAVALPPILIYLRKIMKHPSSNGCLPLQHSVKFAS